MQLLLSKYQDKPHTLLYRRDDGTETRMAADEFFVRHDLSHYALEKTLGYTGAFLGMLNRGMDVKDFEDRAKRKSIPLTDQAVQAENMANLFLMEHTQGRLDDFNGVLVSAFNPMGTDSRPVRLSPEQLDAIRSLLGRLLDTWKTLPAGATMVLDF